MVPCIVLVVCSRTLGRNRLAKTHGKKLTFHAQGAELNELIKHSLTALKESSQNGDINIINTCVAIVGEGMPFTIYDDADVQQYIDLVDKNEISEGAAMQE